MEETELTDSSSAKLKEASPSSSITLVKKQFSGRYAITSEEFTNKMVCFKTLILLFKGKKKGEILAFFFFGY